MIRKLPQHQAEPVARLQSSSIVLNIRHSQTCKSSSEIPTKGTEVSQASILKDTNSKNETPSHIRFFNIPNEQQDSMEEKRPEIC